MNWRRRWVVLVPGEVAWVKRRTRELLEEHDDGREHPFLVVPGQGRYQIIVEGDGPPDVGPHALIGRLLSLECDEPVYAIEGTEEYPYVYRFLKGKEEAEDQEPDALIRALGCVNEWTVEPPPEPLKKTARTVVLIQGLSATQVLNALAKQVGRPLPAGFYRLEEVPQGLLLTDGTAGLGFADIRLSRRFPRATFYAVTASPDLGFFQVTVTQNKKTVQFVPPPKEATYYPAIHEVLGEREPERILAALGIPKEWFQL
jgi:hypothetical protein